MLTEPEVERLIATRRDLHRHPELAFEERRTAEIVAGRLREAGFDVRTGVAVTGVVGTLRGGAGPGPTLLLRADMDALPIDERNEHDYVSTVAGRMHACGHDAHVAVGLAVAERLARRREDWPGEIRYVFQPGEEGAGGAGRMVAEGVLEGVDAALGLHVWSPLESGWVAAVAGAQMAGAREFRITVQGRGGHGAIPHTTVDAVHAASQLVVALQSIVSRNVAPLETAVVSVGAFHAGSASNVIADAAVLEGTTRAFDPAVMERLHERIRAISSGVCTALGATCEVRFSEIVYRPTVNDTRMTAIVLDAAREALGPERVLTGEAVRTMAAEDFSEFAHHVPACYFFVGCRSERVGAIHPHHSPHFEICEDAMPVGVRVLERAALHYLRDGEEAGRP
jgi:amidohydrolase